MPTTEQVTLNADDVIAAGSAVAHLEPKTPVEISRTNSLITITWEPNGTTGVTINEGKIVKPGD